MPNAIERIDATFARLKKKATLVTVAEFGATGRTTYADVMPHTRPDVVISDTAPWHPNQPRHVFARELRNPHRVDPHSDSTDRRRREGLTAVDTIKGLGKPPIVVDGWFSDSPAHTIATAIDAAAIVTRIPECDEIETKALLRSYLNEAGCTTAKTPRNVGFQSASRLPDYADIHGAFGQKFVVQGESIGGNGTRIVTSQSEYERAKHDLQGMIRVSEFIEAPYSTIYCISLPNADRTDVSTYVEVPSFKPIGLEKLGISDVRGGGQDWRGSRPDFDIEDTIQNIGKLASLFYKKFRFQGAFAVEGFINGGDFLFNEINARLCGSSELIGTYQQQEGYPSFVPLHLLGKLGLVTSDIIDPHEFNSRTQERTTRGTPEGAFSLKYKNPHTSALIPSNEYKGPGIYVVEDDRLRWHRTGLSSAEPYFELGEVLIANGPISTEAIIPPGADVCVMESTGATTVFDVTTNRLTPVGEQVASGVINLFEPINI